jgi:hypothetical protein
MLVQWILGTPHIGILRSPYLLLITNSLLCGPLLFRLLGRLRLFTWGGPSHVPSSRCTATSAMKST